MSAIAQGGRFDGREFTPPKKGKLVSFWRWEGEKYAEEHVYVKTKDKDSEGRTIYVRWDDDVHGRLYEHPERKP